MDSALRAVGVLCFGEVGRVLNQRENFPIGKLIERNVILELDANISDSSLTYYFLLPSKKDMVGFLV